MYYDKLIYDQKAQTIPYIASVMCQFHSYHAKVSKALYFLRLNATRANHPLVITMKLETL